MKYRRMGRTGLRVSEICLGTMTFGFQTDEAEALSIMDAAIDGGVNFIDTADVYPLGSNHVGATEEIVGTWLDHKPRYNILWCDLEADLLPLCQDQGVGIIRPHGVPGAAGSRP